MKIITRKEAAKLGLVRYFTGKPCNNGHIAERRVKGGCIPCAITRKLRWQKDNPKQYKESCQKRGLNYRLKNSDKLKESNKNWRRDNPNYDTERYWKDPEKYLKRHKLWRKNNPERAKELDKKYHQRAMEKDPEKVRLQKKLWRDNNPEKQVEAQKRKYLKHREVILEINKRWRKNNPDKAAAMSARRRASKLQATPIWFESEKDLILKVYTKAQQLSKLWNIPLEVDHIIPLQGENVCGLHCWDNLQLLEDTINQSKSNKHNP